MTESVRIEINLSALHHNLQLIKKIAPGRRIIAMIKANAYGHGLAPCAKALDQADAFGVARFAEAKALRDAGIQQKIILMQGVFDPAHWQWAAEHDCDVVVHCVEQITLLKQLSLKKPIRVWLKVNTGLNRLGFPMEHFSHIYETIAALRQVQQPISLMTHFAWSEPDSHAKTKLQADRFQEITRQFSCQTSAIRSASIIDVHDFQSDWIRPGIILYGVSPYSSKRYADLKPVMTVRAKLIATRYQRQHDEIGYGALFQCPEDMLMGIVSIGYGDGYPIAAKAGTPMLIRGKRCVLAARPNMDVLHVDLRACPEARVGDEVILWGDELPVEDVAAASGISAYALLTGMGRRESEIIFSGAFEKLA